MSVTSIQRTVKIVENHDWSRLSFHSDSFKRFKFVLELLCWKEQFSSFLLGFCGKVFEILNLTLKQSNQAANEKLSLLLLECLNLFRFSKWYRIGHLIFELRLWHWCSERFWWPIHVLNRTKDTLWPLIDQYSHCAVKKHFITSKVRNYPKLQRPAWHDNMSACPSVSVIFVHGGSTWPCFNTIINFFGMMIKRKIRWGMKNVILNNRLKTKVNCTH